MGFPVSRVKSLDREGEGDRKREGRRGVVRRIVRYSQASLAVLALLVGSVGFASAAANSRYGPTGLLQIPTADVARPGELGLSIQSDGGSGVAALRFGVIDHVELGLANGVRGKVDIVPHIKVQLAPEGGNNPGVAVGMEDDDFYVVASQQLPSPQYRAHIGLGSSRSLFFGVSAAINPVQVEQGGFRLPSTLLIGEFDGSDLNLGARFSITRDLGLDVGVSDFNHVILGLSYRTQL